MPPLPESTPRPYDEDANEAVFQELVERMRARPIAFVGAGISARCGYPTWRGLLSQMQSAIDQDRAPDASPRERMKAEQEADLLWFAQETRELLGRDRYQELLFEQFRPNGRQPDECAQLLVDLPFRHFLTTNYDEVLEQAHAQRGREARSVPWDYTYELRNWLLELASETPRHIIHLHGIYRDPKSIVLTDEDYEARYSASEGAARKLFSIFATQRVVFLGFGLGDPDLMAVLRQIKANLGGGRAAHLALLPEPEPHLRPYVRRRLRGKFSIEPLFYRADANHTELVALLKRLAGELRPASGVEATARTLSASTQERVTISDEAVFLLIPEGDPDDPQKGRWGGKASVKGYSLSAKVRPHARRKDWYTIDFQVEAPEGTPDGEPVLFHLHPTFHPSVATVPVRGRIASLQLIAYGAFTVGVAARDGAVRLELDLKDLPNVPQEFRDR